MVIGCESTKQANYYKWVQQECRKHKVRFNTCYIGNGFKDYYQYQSLWDNKKDCCDVIGNVKSFKTTSQSIHWDERTRHAANKCMVDESKKAEIEADRIFESPKPSKVRPIREPELSL